MKIFIILLASCFSMFGAASTDTSYFKNISASNGVFAGDLTGNTANFFDANFAFITISNLSASELDVALIVATNGIAMTATPVASLGTPAATTFPIKYSTNVVTSRGLGGYVRWDGTNWMTWENVRATSDETQFVLSAVRDRLIATTPKSTIICSSFYTPVVGVTAATGNYNYSGIPRNVVTGAGAILSTINARASGPFAQITTGTSTTSSTLVRGPFDYISAGDMFACGGSYAVATACDGTDTYSSLVGIVNLGATGFPTDGAFFLYDMFNTWTNGITATNNWICVTGKASAWTFTNSGLPVTVGSTTFDALGLILTTTGCTFYTNGVLAVTHGATTCPAAATVLESNSIQQVKRGAGTTTRQLYEQRPWLHFRYATARTYP